MNLEKSEIIRFPFSPYDMFGYLIPGALLLLGVYLYDHSLVSMIEHPTVPLYKLIKTDIEFINTKNLVFSTMYLLLLVLISYVIGHIIGSVSSISFDKMLVDKGHGYPYQSLLDLNNGNYRAKRQSGFLRGLFFWVNGYVLLQYSGFALQNNYLTTTANILIDVILGFTLINLLIHFVKRYEDYNSKRIILRCIKKGYYVFRRAKISRNIRRGYFIFLDYLWRGIYDFTIDLYSNITRAKDPFDAEFRKLYIKNYTELFEMTAEKSGTNNYWFPFLHTTSHSRQFTAMINNWLVLYSFSRNLATSFLLLFIYMFFSLLHHKQEVILNNQPLLWAPVIVFVFYLIMLSRYYYLYKNYYTKFIIRSFVYTTIMNGRHNNGKK